MSRRGSRTMGGEWRKDETELIISEELGWLILFVVFMLVVLFIYFSHTDKCRELLPFCNYLCRPAR